MEFVTALRGTAFDDGKPSLFELLSEQQLAALLPPTLRYLLTVATHRYPRHLLRVLNSFDELYALAALVVERHYLRTRGGSFTEHFYGLKREKALASEIPRASATAPAIVREALKLDNRDVWKNLIVLIGIPYLKRKLDEAYEINAPRALLGAAYNQLPANASLKERFLFYYRWFLRNIYPSVNAAYYFALLAFNLAYLFDGTKYHSPFMWLIGTRIRRMGAADYRAIDALGKLPAAGGPPGTTSLFSPRNIGSRMLGALSIALPTSIFALKFLEWWYASDFAKQLSRKAAESLDLPPPVVSGKDDTPPSRRISSKKQALLRAGAAAGGEKEKENDDDEARAEPTAENAPIATPSLLPILTVAAPRNSELCPICRTEITTATACQTGIVYCYTCIHKWIAGIHQMQDDFMADKAGKWESGVGRCAVTGRRVLGGTEGLRRIMV